MSSFLFKNAPTGKNKTPTGDIFTIISNVINVVVGPARLELAANPLSV
tara:strand:+ start:389 stop:532 length:144 start_codon:yes stop_codon:yes gene_type:complete